MFMAEVRIGLKHGVADPEGANTRKALELLGFKGVKRVDTVKVFRLELDVSGRDEAQRQVDDICRRLLANPVIHTYEVALKPVAAKGSTP